MNKKQLRYSFNMVLNAVENIKCEDIHHKKSHQHESDEMCPALYEIHSHANILRNFMKDNFVR